MGKWSLGLLGLFCCVTIDAVAFANRDSLIQESLKNIRNPKVLEGLSDALLEYEDSEMQARGYFVKGLAYNYAAKANESSEAYRKALSFMHPDSIYDQRFTYPVVLRNLGISYYRSQNFQKGDSVFVRLRDLAIAKGDSLDIAMAQKSMANAMMMREDFDSAVVLMKEAVRIQEKLDYQGVPLTYLSMGSVFGRMSQPEEANRWFKLALTKLRNGKAPDRRMEGRVLNNIAVAFRDMDQLDSAQYYLKEALAIHKALGSIFDQVEVRGNLARNAIEMGMLDTAHRYLDEALTMVDENNPRSSQVLQNISLLSFDLAIKEKDLADADKWFTKFVSDLGYSRIKSDYRVMESLGRYFELKGEADSALAYFKASDAIQESLQKQQDARAIKKAANDVELIGLKSEQVKLKARYRKIFTYAILIFGFSFIVLWLYWRFRGKKVEELSSQLGQEVQFQFQDKNQIQELRLDDKVNEEKAQLKLKSKAVLSVSEIIYAQSEGHYVSLFLDGKTNPEVDRSSLKALQEELRDFDFQRIHRSYLVNCKYLKAVYATKVLLNNGTELPVSRTYKDDLQARFKEKPLD